MLSRMTANDQLNFLARQRFKIQKFQRLKPLASHSIEAPPRGDDRLEPSNLVLNLELLLAGRE